MRTADLTVETSGRRVVDITDPVRKFAAQGEDTGLVNVFLPHATAGVALMETGSGSESDLVRLLDEWMPREDRYEHRHGVRGHGRDHMLPVFVPPSISIPVEEGRLVLGTWQSVVIVDPNESNNTRRVRLSFLKG